MAEKPHQVSEVDEPILDGEVGYGKPPRSSRFQKGRSGNPRGRPRRRKSAIPYDHVLGQMVTVREDGRERRITAAEAFLLHLTRKGLAGDSAAARSSLAAIETARGNRSSPDTTLTVIVVAFIGMGIEGPLEDLGLGVLHHPYDKDRATWKINPRIVEAAIARLGDRKLTIEDQEEVYRATRTPSKVNWPEWWTAYKE